jgi:hypothetical protein
MNHTFHITGLFTLPTHGALSNVLAKVQWEIVFAQDGHESIAGGETLLDVDNIEQFTPFEQVTAAQVSDWVLTKEGGQTFIDMLTDIHKSILEQKAVDAKVVKATPSFQLAQPASVPSVTYDLSQIE